LYPKTKTQNSLLTENNFFTKNKSQEKSPTQENPFLKIKNWAIGIGAVVAMNIGGSSDITKNYTPLETQPVQQEQLANLKSTQSEASIEQNNQILDSLQNQEQEIIKDSLSLESLNGKNPTEQFQALQRNMAKVLGLINTILLIWKAYNIKEYGKSISKENSSIQNQGRDVAENGLIWLAEAVRRFLAEPSITNFVLLLDSVLDSVKSMVGLLKVATDGKQGEMPDFGVIKEFLTADIDLSKINMQEIGQSIAKFQAKYPGEIANLVRQLTQNPGGAKNLLENAGNKLREFLPKDLEGKIDLAGNISLLIAFLFLPSSVPIIISNLLEMRSNFTLLKDKNGPGFGYKAQEGLFNLGSAVSSDPLYSFVGISQLLVQLTASATKRIDNQTANYLRTNLDKLKNFFTPQQNQPNQPIQTNETLQSQSVNYSQSVANIDPNLDTPVQISFRRQQLLQQLSNLKNQNLN
jgi:hypothetical protein